MPRLVLRRKSDGAIFHHRADLLATGDFEEIERPSWREQKAGVTKTPLPSGKTKKRARVKNPQTTIPAASSEDITADPPKESLDQLLAGLD